jgi:hypothetical protein
MVGPFPEFCWNDHTEFIFAGGLLFTIEINAETLIFFLNSENQRLSASSIRILSYPLPYFVRMAGRVS